MSDTTPFHYAYLEAGIVPCCIEMVRKACEMAQTIDLESPAGKTLLSNTTATISCLLTCFMRIDGHGFYRLARQAFCLP